MIGQTISHYKIIEKLSYAKVEDAVSIAIQIGDALHEAHSKRLTGLMTERN